MSLAGLGIRSLRDTAEKMRVIKRHALRGSQNKDLGHLFMETSSKHVDTDLIVTSNPSRRSALSSLKNNQKSDAWLHMLSLPVQGASIAIMKDAVPKQTITLWSKYMVRSSAVIHNFARKALQSITDSCKSQALEKNRFSELSAVRWNEISNKQARLVELQLANRTESLQRAS